MLMIEPPGKVLRFGLLIFLVFFTGMVQAQETRPEDWIIRLGEDLFEVRQEAERELFRLGRQALPALKKATNHPDPNTRSIARRLVADFSRSPGQKALEDFLQNKGASKLPSLPGWTRIKEIIGDDFEARLLYVDLWDHEKLFLRLLESNPEKASNQLESRIRQFRLQFQQANGPQAKGNNNPNSSVIPEQYRAALSALILSAHWFPMNQHLENSFYELLNNVPQPEILRKSPSIHRLLVYYAGKRIRSLEDIDKVRGLVASLELHGLIESHIVPILEKDLDRFIKEENVGQIMLAKNIIYSLNQKNRLEASCRKTLKKLADIAHRKGDIDSLGSALDFCKLMEYEDLYLVNLRSKAGSLIDDLTDLSKIPGENEAILSRIQEISNASHVFNMANLKEVYEQKARKIVIRMFPETIEDSQLETLLPDFINIAKMLNMEDFLVGVIKPVVRKKILDILEKGDPGIFDWILKVTKLCSILGHDDPITQITRKIFEQNGPMVLARTTNKKVWEDSDIERLRQFHSIALMLGFPDLVEKNLKPPVLKYLKTATIPASDPKGINNLVLLLEIARGLELSDADSLAIRLASSKAVSGEGRAKALQYIGLFGGVNKIRVMESFLKDTSIVSYPGLNLFDIKITTEIRDVALAIILESKMENPADFGFPYYRMAHGASIYNASPVVAGFDSEKSREAAFKKYTDLVSRP